MACLPMADWYVLRGDWLWSVGVLVGWWGDLSGRVHPNNYMMHTYTYIIYICGI